MKKQIKLNRFWFAVVLVAFFVLLAMGVGAIIVAVAALALLTFIPHLILRKLGRRGFISESHDEATGKTVTALDISGAAFRKT